MHPSLRRLPRAFAPGAALLALSLSVFGCHSTQPPIGRRLRVPPAARALDLATLERAEASESSTAYDWRRELDAFAALPVPPILPVFPAGAYTRNAPSEVWWPDLAGYDAVARRLRARFIGRRVYGYGGIAVSCLPMWTRYYGPATGLRVRSIDREDGVVDWLAGGHGTGAPYMFGIGFLAYAPLVFVVDPAPLTAVSEGSNYGVAGGMPTRCPALKLADFQIDTKLSLAPPPFPIGAAPRPVRVGMTREEVIWTQGYPEELSTKAAMLRESVWRYGGAMNQYTTVTFRRDRVISVHIPPMM